MVSSGTICSELAQRVLAPASPVGAGEKKGGEEKEKMAHLSRSELRAVAVSSPARDGRKKGKQAAHRSNLLRFFFKQLPPV